MLTAADVHVDGYPTVEAVRWIGEQLERETDGRLRMRLYHSGQLGRESDTIDLARFGAIDFTRVHFGALNNAFPLTQVLCAAVRVRLGRAHAPRARRRRRAARSCDGFERARPRRPGDLRLPARAASTTRAARSSTPADLHGLKMRVPPSDIFIELVRALGANPTPLPYGEVFSALQTHLIDGAENNWRSFHSSRQFEAARYWSQTEHSYAPEALLMSQRTLRRAVAGDRELLLATARASRCRSCARCGTHRRPSRAQRCSPPACSRTKSTATPSARAAQPLLERYLREPDCATLRRVCIARCRDAGRIA